MWNLIRQTIDNLYTTKLVFYDLAKSKLKHFWMEFTFQFCNEVECQQPQICSESLVQYIIWGWAIEEQDW